MDVLIDTNVILNFITRREDKYLDASIQTMLLCAGRRCNGYVAFHTIPTIWYILRKAKPEQEVRSTLQSLCDILTLAGASHSQVVRAVLNKDFKDFEDCLQDECAQNANADYLITCNKKDFSTAKTKVVTPDEFLQIIEKVQGHFNQWKN